MTSQQILDGEIVGVFDMTKDGKPYTSKDGKPEYLIGLIVEGFDSYQQSYVTKDRIYPILDNYNCGDVYGLVGK